MSDLWFKEAIIYSLDVETFQDSDGDGIGDFRGLTRRLDYLAALGVTAIWLQPFYPSPRRDNGYDVTDHYGVDPRFGSPGDFVVFLREARERGLRVLVDLVVNHTSSDHLWFQSARQSRESPFHDYYVWEDDPAGQAAKFEPVFPGEQDSVWTWVPEVQSHYLHHFYEHQPDLNVLNPGVRDEIHKIMGYWLELGVSGFRVDAAPFIIELTAIEGNRPDDPHEILRDMREFLSWRKGDAVLLAEANVAPDEISDYFCGGNEMHMLFSFILNQGMFLALAREDARPLAEALLKLPLPPARSTWANFVRNHDELTLDQLSDSEREEVFARFAPDENMRLYERGIRRRLPPMLRGNAQHIRLVYSLLMSLPGTPVLRYGEEIGMGEDLSLEGRYSVRTPMQWSGDANGGFSTADAHDLVRPVIEEGPYGYRNLNVAAQRQDPGSLLSGIHEIVRARKECPEFGQGEWRLLETGDPRVLGHSATWRGGTVIALHNLSEAGVAVTLDGDAIGGGYLENLLSGGQDEHLGEKHLPVTLEPYGYRWYRCVPRAGGAAGPNAQVEGAEADRRQG